MISHRTLWLARPEQWDPQSLQRCISEAGHAQVLRWSIAEVVAGQLRVEATLIQED